MAIYKFGWIWSLNINSRGKLDIVLSSTQEEIVDGYIDIERY